MLRVAIIPNCQSPARRLIRILLLFNNLSGIICYSLNRKLSENHDVFGLFSQTYKLKDCMFDWNKWFSLDILEHPINAPQFRQPLLKVFVIESGGLLISFNQEVENVWIPLKQFAEC
jgi:hypothetical protein